MQASLQDPTYEGTKNRDEKHVRERIAVMTSGRLGAAENIAKQWFCPK